MAGGFFLTVEVTGGDRVAAGLAAFQNIVKDLRGFWRDVFAPKFFGSIQDRFDLQGQGRDAFGRFTTGRWAPLSHAYAEWKARHFPGRQILERTLALRESMQWSLGGTVGPGGVFVATPSFVMAGTSIRYGKAHQKGGPHLPARPFLVRPDPNVMGPLMKEWILREVRAKGVTTTS